jgi:hypothetical protein
MQEKRSVSIPSLMSEAPLNEQSVPDQMLTGLWGGLIDTPTDAPTAAKIGAAIGEVGNPFGDAKNLLAVSAIPPKMAREVGRRLVDKIKQEAPGMGQIWERLYEAYPRLVGNLSDVQFKRLGNAPDGAPISGMRDSVQVTRGENDITKFYKENELMHEPPLEDARLHRTGIIGIDPIKAAQHGPVGAANTAAHELTHQAQGLMVNNLPEKYSLETVLHGGGREGYLANKYEKGANKAADNFTRRYAEAERTGESLQEVRRRLRKMPPAVREVPTPPGIITQLLSRFGLAGPDPKDAMDPLEREVLKRTR